MLKVVGGEFRGRKLASLPGEATRPPLSRVRAAVANILAEYVEDARVLDLFAGTGSYAIELLSRGAIWATCVDISPKAIKVIRGNMASLGLQGNSRIIQGHAISTLGMLEAGDAPYRITVVAPPYFKGLDIETMNRLGKSPLVDKAGIVVLQQHKTETFRESYGNLELRKTYLYGVTRISTYLFR